MTSLQDNISYLFLHAGSSTDLVVETASVLVPTQIARHRAVWSAKKGVFASSTSTPDAPAGTWSTAKKQARQELERFMADQVDAITGIEGTSARATQRRRAARGEQVRWGEETQLLVAFAERLVTLEPA